MESCKGYYDYCISEQCVTSGNFEKTAKLLIGFGYRTIAVNQTVNMEDAEPNKKKKKKGERRDDTDVVPAPIDVKRYEGCEELKVLNRLTIIFGNQEVFQKITKSPNYKKYHILAALPTTQQAFQYTCSSVEGDILTVDPENKIPYRINRKLYNQLVERGYHFEILYGPAILDSTQRKNMIQVSHFYHACGKSKNVIISSGATNKFLIRSPYDIINLGLIFGLSEEKTKNAIYHCGRNVHTHSGRRHGKAVMFAENLETQSAGTDAVIISSSEDDDEEMELDQPAQKKSKQ